MALAVLMITEVADGWLVVDVVLVVGGRRRVMDEELVGGGGSGEGGP